MTRICMFIISMFMSACFNPSFPSGLACSDLGTCPPGQSCILPERRCQPSEHPDLATAALSPDLSFGTPPRPGADTLLSRILLNAFIIRVGRPGYVITATAGYFRVVWTGPGVHQGSVFADRGQLIGFTEGCADGSCPLVAAEDMVQRRKSDSDAVDFYSKTTSGRPAGFTVQVASGPLYVDLFQDGVRRPDVVYFYSADLGSVVVAATLPIGLDPSASP